VTNIALPQLSTALHATTGQLQWIASAFTLVAGVGMLPAANLADRYGRKRLLAGSLVLFAAASGWCALSGASGELIAAQAVLGLAGAALLPLGFAMLPTLFPDPGERARAVMIWTAASAVGLPLGPVIGGLLLDHFWWGAVFLPNAGLALVGVAAVAVVVPEARSSRPVALDIPGAALSSAALAGVIYGFINAGQYGWGSAGTWAPILAGAVLLAGFVAFERRSAHPLIELGLFRNGHFVWGTVHATIANFAFFGMLFAVPQYFQSVDGITPLGTGIRLLPMALGLVIGTQFGGPLAKLSGVGTVIAAGFALAAAGLAYPSPRVPGFACCLSCRLREDRVRWWLPSEVVTLVEVGDQPRVLGLPPEPLLGQGAGGGAVQQGERGHPAEVARGLLAGDGGHREVQVSADDGGDVAERDGLVGHPVQPRPGGRFLQRQPEQVRGVQQVHAAPAAGPVARVRGDPPCRGRCR
jgi:MFS family permease